jgi:hypothetical protein
MANTNRPRPLSDLVPGLTKDIFGRKNMLFGKMLTEWAQIAGAEMAARTMPLDLKFSRPPARKQKAKSAPDANIHKVPTLSDVTAYTGIGQAVLHLAVQPSYALELSYQKSLLIERLNIFFGYPAIKDIKIIQDSNVMSNSKLPKPHARPVTLQEERTIEAIVSSVKENDLQTALKNLGKSIISRVK